MRISEASFISTCSCFTEYHVRTKTKELTQRITYLRNEILISKLIPVTHPNPSSPAQSTHNQLPAYIYSPSTLTQQATCETGAVTKLWLSKMTNSWTELPFAFSSLVCQALQRVNKEPQARDSTTGKSWREENSEHHRDWYQGQHPPRVLDPPQKEFFICH